MITFYALCVVTVLTGLATGNIISRPTRSPVKLLIAAMLLSGFILTSIAII